MICESHRQALQKLDICYLILSSGKERSRLACDLSFDLLALSATVPVYLCPLLHVPVGRVNLFAAELTYLPSFCELIFLLHTKL